MQKAKIIYFIPRYLHFFKSPEKKREYFARRLVGFSQEQMHEVVADVKNYDKFVPFCTKSIITSDKKTKLEANLEVGFPPIIENYTSHVTCIKPFLVQAICRDGKLFSYLETTWKFSEGLKSNPKSCIVDFYINFEFKSALYSKLSAMLFEVLVKQMERAFINEAKRRYGRESLPSHSLTVMKS